MTLPGAVLRRLASLSAPVITSAILAQAPTQPQAPPAAMVEPDYHGGHSRGAAVAIFSPDGRVLASGGQEVFVWEAATGRVIRRVPIPTAVSALFFTADGRLLGAGGGGGGHVVGWDVNTSRQIFSLTTVPERRPTGVTVSPPATPSFGGIVFIADGTRLAAYASVRDIKSDRVTSAIAVWDWTSGALLREVPSRADIPYYRDTGGGFAISPDGKLLAADSDSGLKLWEITTGSELRTLTGASVHPRAVAFSGNGRWLAAVTGPGKVGIWDTSTWRLAHELPADGPKPDGIIGLAFVANGSQVATVEDSGSERATFWNASSGQRASASVHAETGAMRLTAMLDFSPDGQLAALPSLLGDVRLVDTTTGSTVRTFATPVLRSFRDWCLLRRGPLRPSSTPPAEPIGRLLFSEKSLPQTWRYWSVEIDVENHSDTAQNLTAPSFITEIYLRGGGGMYPVVSVLPANSEMVGFSMGVGNTTPVEMGNYVLRAPSTSVKVGPHQKVTLQLVFVAPTKVEENQLSMFFGNYAPIQETKPPVG